MTCDEGPSSSLVQAACTHLKTLNKKIILKVRGENRYIMILPSQINKNKENKKEKKWLTKAYNTEDQPRLLNLLKPPEQQRDDSVCVCNNLLP